MKIALFYHSLLSDWNHGNAHFLRGVAWELIKRGHQLSIYEPADGWSLQHLLRQSGTEPIGEFYRAYPGLDSISYDLKNFGPEQALDDVDLALVHEWNDHDLVRRIGAHRKARGGYKLFFHDTHHRSVTQPETMAAYDLSGYDGVLAYGEAIAQVYLSCGWARRIYVWHEAADVRLFRPISDVSPEGDLIWVGNWGDGERTAELQEFLIKPVKALGLAARVYGVRYPGDALDTLADAGIEYGGWAPNYRVPELFARFRVTIHVQRRPYAETLPGIPTIRPFEALACGIPLVCSPWTDSEGLFTAGKDYLLAREGAEMTSHLRALLAQPGLQAALARHGRNTILERHTCAHRVDQLLKICQTIDRADGITRDAGLAQAETAE
jgi:spore maturation protein CgeB